MELLSREPGYTSSLQTTLVDSSICRENDKLHGKVVTVLEDGKEMEEIYNRGERKVRMRRKNRRQMC